MDRRILNGTAKDHLWNEAKARVGRHDQKRHWQSVAAEEGKFEQWLVKNLEAPFKQRH
jgi:hypothetical protein